MAFALKSSPKASSYASLVMKTKCPRYISQMPVTVIEREVPSPSSSSIVSPTPTSRSVASRSLMTAPDVPSSSSSPLLRLAKQR